MSVLTISPGTGSYNVSPTTHVVVLGSVLGETFDYSTLEINVNGDAAYASGSPTRPAFDATVAKAPSSFSASVRPRRAFLYRVKVTVNVSIDTNVRNYTQSAVFEIRPETVSLALGTLRYGLDAQFAHPSSVAVNAVSQQLFGLLGGASMGAYAVRLMRRVYLSQLWPMMRVFISRDGNNPIWGVFAEAMEQLGPEDAAVRGDVRGALGMIEIFWEPAVQQLIEVGASVPFAELLNRSFRSDNDLEKIAAACALVLFTRSVEANGDDIRAFFSAGYV